MITLSEIDTTSKRATKAAGFSWGIAEEVGKNMRLLELYGLSGIKNLNEYFKNYKKKQYQKVSLISETNYSQKIPYCPIILGTNFLDQVTLLENINEIQFKNVAFPLLLLPFVSRASDIIGKRIFMKIDEKEFLLNFNQSIYSNYLKSEILENSKLIKINFIENKNTFKENEWNELYKLSEDTFVEETDSLKASGAGAGLTDND
jgi:hypothetical protein|tara:strand:+ start:464 stop:1075 length:612 start_codon:yes stop_codon:yes gene_type:complete